MQGKPLFSREELARKIDRYKRFYANGKPGDLLVAANFYDPPSENLFDKFGGLDSYDLENDNIRFVKNTYASVAANWANRASLDDDYMPVIGSYYGIAQHSAYMGEIPFGFGFDTSWPEPIIKDWSDLDKIRLSEDHWWVKRLIEFQDFFSEKAREDNFILQTTANFSPVDMANALRGNQLFTDFYDSPDELRRLLDISVEGVIWLEDLLDKHTYRATEGTGMWGVWLPGKSIAMSEDATALISSELYREFCFPYTQRLIDHYDGAFIHLHSLGVHQIKEMARLKNLHLIEISQDFNTPRTVTMLRRITDDASGVPIYLMGLTPQEIIDNIAVLKRGRFILECSAETLEDAERVLAVVRENSNIT